MPGNIINLTPADIAAWPTPNYDNPDEETWATPYAVIWYAASTLLLGLRLWLRFTAKAGNVGLDDVSDHYVLGGDFCHLSSYTTAL